jgi:membrane glycosyltransferase
MEVNLNIIGILLMVLAIAHSIFPAYFKWDNELHRLSLINRQMMYVHTFFIALVLLLMGLLCVTSAHEIVHTQLGKRLCLGIAIFWTARLLIQFFGYSPALWRGKRLESGIHVLFAILWAYLSASFAYIFFEGALIN